MLLKDGIRWWLLTAALCCWPFPAYTEETPSAKTETTTAGGTTVIIHNHIPAQATSAAPMAPPAEFPPPAAPPSKTASPFTFVSSLSTLLSFRNHFTFEPLQGDGEGMGVFFALNFRPSLIGFNVWTNLALLSFADRKVHVGADLELMPFILDLNSDSRFELGFVGGISTLRGYQTSRIPFHFGVVASLYLSKKFALTSSIRANEHISICEGGLRVAL